MLNKYFPDLNEIFYRLAGEYLRFFETAPTVQLQTFLASFRREPNVKFFISKFRPKQYGKVCKYITQNEYVSMSLNYKVKPVHRRILPVISGGPKSTAKSFLDPCLADFSTPSLKLQYSLRKSF